MAELMVKLTDNFHQSIKCLRIKSACLFFLWGSRLRVPVFVFQGKIIIGEEIFSFVPYRLKIR
jgi:hypothetical protein